MDEKVQRALENAGITYMGPSEGSYNLIGSSRHALRKSANLNKAYEDNVNQMTAILNQNSRWASTSLGKEIRSPEGTPVFRLFNTPFNTGAQRHIEAYTKMKRAQDLYMYDIETLGNALDKKDFSVSEIAIQGFTRKYGGLKPSNENLTMLISPSEKVRNHMTGVMQRLIDDPYSYNLLSEWEKRTLIDATRYSMLAEDGVSPARFVKSGDVYSDIQHNTLASNLMKNESILTPNVISNMEQVVRHAEDGLQQLANIDVSKEEAISKLNEFLERKKNEVFVSYNGESFDLPALEVWGNGRINLPKHHADYYEIIQTVYPNSYDLHRRINPDFNPRELPFGATRLQAFRSTLGFDMDAAHSSTHDIGSEGLGGVVANTEHLIYEEIRKNRRIVTEGLERRAPGFSWGHDLLQKGDTLYAVGGARARRDGEFSFNAEFDPVRGVFNPINTDFNQVVLNAKTKYTVQDILDLSDGRTQRLGLQLFNEDMGHHTFIVREGNDAMDQIASFVQNRFYNYNNMPGHIQEEVKRRKLTDSARRKYESMFEISGSERGVSRGFESAKRLYENAKILERRIAGKHGNIAGENYGSLVQNRITHAQMEEMLEGRFNSLWDAENKVWTHNQKEKEAFFRMGSRLISERERFQEAISFIDSSFSDSRDKDIAWKMYTDKVFGSYGVPKEEVDLMPMERYSVPYQDFSTGSSRTLNLRSQESAIQSIRSFVYSLPNTENMTREYREDRYRERLNLFIKNLRDNQIIDTDLSERILSEIQESGSVHASITDIGSELYSSDDIVFPKTVEQTSIGPNRNIENLDEKTNQLLYREAVEKAKGFRSFEFHPKAEPGARVVFSPEVEKMLERLDQVHLSGLDPRNRIALEKILMSAIENDRYKGLDFSVSKDMSSSNVRFTFYSPSDSVSVVDSLAEGKTHPKAVNIDVPLISEAGVHEIGNRRLNARTILDRENGRIVRKSTSDIIAERYQSRMDWILGPLVGGDAETANARSKRALNDAVRELSGIQRNLTFSDSFDANFNLNESDFQKQAVLDIERALIKDVYERTKVNPEGVGGLTLTDRDFYESPLNAQGELRHNISLEDIKSQKAFDLLVRSNEWLEDVGVNAYIGSVKGDHAAKALYSLQDIRNYIPYGHYTFMGRDNTVQYMNTHVYESDVVNALRRSAEDIGAYLNFDHIVRTDGQKAWEEMTGADVSSNRRGMNVKVVHMNDGQFMKRLEQLRNTNFNDLLEANIINSEGHWNYSNLPTIYENQGVIAQEIQDLIKVREQKILSQTDNIELFKQYQDGSTVQPGQLLGYELEGGYKRPLRYQGDTEGTVLFKNGRVGVSWQEEAFKHTLEGEKVTDVPLSKRLIELITGDSEATVIMNANMIKHRDFSMYMSGKAKLLGIHTQEKHLELMRLQEEAQRYRNSKKRQVAAQKAQAEFNRIIGLAGDLNLEWDPNEGVYFQRGSSPIQAERFDQVLDELGIRHRAQAGGETFETSVLELRSNKVSNWSAMVDSSGYQVHYMKEDAEGNLKPVYRRDSQDRLKRGGVSFGHRELGVLRGLGLTETHDYIHNVMLSQAQETGRLQESRSLVSAIVGAANPDHELVSSAGTLRASNFRSTPKIDPDMNTFRKTIFDQDHIRALTGAEGDFRGFWLEMPSVISSNNVERKITLNIDGAGTDRVGVDKIFIPNTKLDQTGSEVHLRNLQRSISRIYEKARAVDEAGGYDARVGAFNELQTSVDDYYKQLSYDVTSSKGQTGSSVLRTRMPSSGSGLFKLLDPEMSRQLEGEYTFISTEDAKKMGIYERLSKGQDLYTINIRYPVFHDHAMQVSKIRMSDSVKPGEFKTTSWMSDLMGADSDGDMGGVTVIDDESIQKELKKRYDQKQLESERAYQKLLEKESRSGRGFDARSILGDSPEFRAFDPNTQEEIAAKIGKRVIGLSSNLNLAMRQAADEFLFDDLEARKAIQDFGQQLEQSPISSKHGFTVERGRAPSIELVNAIYNSNWDKAREIRNQYFDEDIDQELMERALKGLDSIKERTRGGLRAPIYKVGTSFGVRPEEGLGYLSNLLTAEIHPSQITQTNTSLNLIHDFMGVQNEKSYVDVTGVEHIKVNPYESLYEARSSSGSGPSIGSRVGEVFKDLTSLGHQEGGSSMKRFFESLSENRTAKWGVVSAGLALAGLGIHNVFKYRDPITSGIETEDDMYYNSSNSQGSQMSPSASARRGSPVSNSSQNLSVGSGQVNADISVQASGRRMSDSELSQMVNQGIQNAGMNTGPSKVSINYTDNTSRLNRIWYRDRVQENIV